MDNENIYEKMLKRGKEAKTVSEQLEPDANRLDIEKLEETSKLKVKTALVASKTLSNQIYNTLDEYISLLLDDIKKYLDIKLKQQKIIDKLQHFIQNKLNLISEKISSVKNKIKNLSIYKDMLVPAFESMKNIVGSLYDFFSKSFKKGWSLIDSFMNSISPNAWSLVKTVVSTVSSAFMWLWKVGKKAIEYIYEGVSVIFKAGFFVISSAAKILYKGAKGLFSWWFGMLINTLTNPTMLIINLPIFLGITGALFIALGTVGSLIFDMSKALIEPIFKISSKLFSWIWSGVEILWTWIQNVYESSGIKGFVDTTFKSAKNWLMDNTVIKNVVNIISKVYTWVVENGIPIAKKVWDFTKKIVNFVKTNAPSSMIVSFLNLLNGDSMEAARNYIPGFSKLTKYLTSKYGFLPGIIGGASMSLADMRRDKTEISKKQVSTIIEFESLKLLDKGYSEIDVKNELLKNIIPKIQSTLESAKIPKEEINKLLDESVSGSKNILKSGGVGMVTDYEKAIAAQKAVILSYENVLEKAKSGLLDPTEPHTNKVLNSLRNKMIKVTDSINRTTEKTMFKNTGKTIDDLMSLQKEMEYKNKRKTKLLSIEEFTDRFYDAQDYAAMNAEIGDVWLYYKNRSLAEKIALSTYAFRNSVHNIAGHAIDDFSNYAIDKIAVAGSFYTGGDMESIHETIANRDKHSPSYYITGSDAQRYNIEQEEILSSSADIARLSNVNAPTKHATGGIKTPETPKIKPLDLEAAKFIRSKIDNMSKNNKMDKSKDKKDEASNITIIENYIAKQESYETYLLSQLSRGLLAGG